MRLAGRGSGSGSASVSGKPAHFLCDRATKGLLVPFIAVTASMEAHPQMNGIIYIVGLIVIIMAILSFIGLR